MGTEHADILTVIRTRVQANLAAINGAWTDDDVAWPGASLELPGKDSWMRMDVFFTDNRQVELNGTERIDGFLQLSFFQKPASGVDVMVALMQYVDAAKGVFSLGLSLAAGARFVRFLAPIADPYLADEEGWIHQPLRCPFYLDTP